MKKLITIFGCLTAIILMSSCTADSVEGPNTEALKKENQISPSASTSSKPATTIGTNTGTGTNTGSASKAADGVDDKDKAQG